MLAAYDKYTNNTYIIGKIQDRGQIKNSDHAETKHNPEKANNAKQN